MSIVTFALDKASEVFLPPAAMNFYWGNRLLQSQERIFNQADFTLNQVEKYAVAYQGSPVDKSLINKWQAASRQITGHMAEVLKEVATHKNKNSFWGLANGFSLPSALPGELAESVYAAYEATGKYLISVGAAIGQSMESSTITHVTIAFGDSPQKRDLDWTNCCLTALTNNCIGSNNTAT